VCPARIRRVYGVSRVRGLGAAKLGVPSIVIASSALYLALCPEDVVSGPLSSCTAHGCRNPSVDRSRASA
jgi:hypothetical protein